MDKETLLAKFKPSIGDPNAATQNYENLGVSVRTLDTYVDTILSTITDDATVTDDFVKNHVNILKAMGGQLRHEYSEFTKNYKPVEPQPKPNTPTDNPELKELKNMFEELKSQLKGQQQKNAANDLRKSVLDKSKELKVKNKALWDDVVNSIEVTEGMESTTLESKVKSAYEAKLKSYFGDGAQPYSVDNSPKEDKNASEKMLDDYFARKAKEGKFPSLQK